MRALSIRQPWAWAILHAGKRVENRGWKAAPKFMIGESFLIHAAQGMTRAEYDDAIGFMEQIGVVRPGAGSPGLVRPRMEELVRGAIVGRARLVAAGHGIVTGDRWAVAGAMHLSLGNVEEIAVPVRVRGALGFFEPLAPALVRAMWKSVSP